MPIFKRMTRKEMADIRRESLASPGFRYELWQFDWRGKLSPAEIKKRCAYLNKDRKMRERAWKQAKTLKRCEHPDRDCPKLKCGYPLPCPFHTVRVGVVIEKMKKK